MKKKMKKYQIMLLLAGILCLLTLTGCGKETPQSLAKSVITKLNNVKSIDTDVVLDFAANIDVSSINAEIGIVEMTMTADLELEATVDPAAAHSEGIVSVLVMDQGQTQDAESYAVIEDGTAVTYTLMDGQWVKSTEAGGLDDMLDLSLYNDIASGRLEAELDEETAVVNGKDAYLLHTVLSGDNLKNMMSVSSGGVNSLDEDSLDWETVSADLNIYIYKDTKLPAKAKLDCRELGGSMVAASMGDAGEVTVKKFNLEIVWNQYDSVDEIVLPQEARNAVDVDSINIMEPSISDEDTDSSSSSLEDPSDASEPDEWEYYDEELTPDTDGNYTMYSDDRDYAAIITLMDGQEFSFGSGSYLSSSSTDYTQAFVDFTYQFLDYYTLDEIAEDRADCSWMDNYDDYENINPGTVQEMTLDGRSIYWVKNTYDMAGGYGATHFEDISGWMQVGDIIFVIDIESYGDPEDAFTASEKTLADAFARVTFND